MLVQTCLPTVNTDDCVHHDDGKWYTASSGHPPGELDDTLVVVTNDSEAARFKLEVELKTMGLDCSDWVWSGAGSQVFDSETEAIAFANYRMGCET